MTESARDAAGIRARSYNSWGCASDALSVTILVAARNRKCARKPWMRRRALT